MVLPQIASEVFGFVVFTCCPTTVAVFVCRAATIVYQLMLVKQKIDRQSFEPLVIRNTIPVCMAQYGRVFSTTR